MGLKEKILYKLMGTNEEIETIYKQKGHCDEWVEAYKNGHPKMKVMDKLTLADALVSLEKFDEAEALLESVNVGITADDITKGTYFLVLINLYIGQNRAADALAILEKHGKFLNIFYSAPAYQRMGGAFYDSAAVVLAMNDYHDDASRYYELEKQWAAKYDKTGIYPMITNVRLLKLVGNEEAAQNEAETARNYINNYNGLDMPWQKNSFLKMLDKALN